MGDAPIQGLSAAEVRERTARGEVNRVPDRGWAEYRGIIARNLFTVFNGLVTPAAIALFVLGDYRGAWAVSALAIINTVMGLTQEIRAKRQLDRLAILATTHARVIRDGKEVEIDTRDIVLGDAVRVHAGDAVPVDGTVLEAAYLEVDEALLTGESDPVPRTAGDRLLSGSLCIAGEGIVRAEGIGEDSYACRTEAEARQYQRKRGPLQLLLDRLVAVLTGLAVALCVGYLALALFRPLSLMDLVRMWAATITAMVPQGLVLMATMAFVLGAVRLSLQGAIVQHLGAVESMAAVDVLCIDKTGTLTTGRMTLEELVPLHDDPAKVREALGVFVWSTQDRNASIQALRQSVPRPDYDTQATLVDRIPFKAQNRYSVVQVRPPGDSTEQTLVLGAVEALQPMLADTDDKSLSSAWDKLLHSGLRVLFLAEVEPGTVPTPLGTRLEGALLRPLALLGLGDELRSDVDDVLTRLVAEGVDVKVLSGDHPATVRATVSRIPLPQFQREMVTGDQLAASGITEEILQGTSIYARVDPRQKIEIVDALRARGHHVAMLGDGINDALAIKRASLGIAMGSGAVATRSVASLVLRNDTFGLLPQALREGRIIVHNLRRASKLFLLKNVYTLVLIVFALGLLGMPFPYLPQQVTLLNKLTIGTPALLILLGRVAPPVRNRKDLIREVVQFVLGAGVIIGVHLLGLMLYADRVLELSPASQRAIVVTAVILIGLGNAILVSNFDRRLIAWAAVAIVLLLLAMYWPDVAYFFVMDPLPLAHWTIVGIVVASALVGCGLWYRVSVSARRAKKATP